MKILIADDESAVCSVLKYQIMKFSLPFIEIKEVNNGLLFLENCIDWNPDIAFVDIKMPGLDGLEAIEKIMEAENIIDTHFYILTGFGEFEYAQKALRLKVCDYILKPSKIEVIHEILFKEFRNIYLGVSLIKYDKIKLIDEFQLNQLSLIIQELSKNFKFEENNLFNENLNLWFDLANKLELEIDEDYFLKHFSKKYSNIIQEQKDLLVLEASSWFSNFSKNGFSINLRKFLNKNYSNPDLNLDYISNYFGFTPQYLSIVFKNEFGELFVNYITKLRIEKSKELLITTRKKIKEISFECGYYYPSYFIKVFNKYTNMTPLDYRNKYTKNYQ